MTGGLILGVPPTWQVFKFTRLLQGLRSLRIIRFIGGLRVLVYSMFLDFLVEDAALQEVGSNQSVGEYEFRLDVSGEHLAFLGQPKLTP